MPLAVPDDALLRALANAAGFTIRQAQIGDLQAMAAIAEPQHYEAPDDLTPVEQTVFVACDLTDNDRLSGFLWFLRSAWDGAGFFVRLVMTHPDKQRRGLGSLLMAFAAEAMHDSEHAMPISLVVATNNAAARAWYTKLDIVRVAGDFPDDLPEEESEVGQGDQGNYEFRRNASSAVVRRNALRILKLRVQGQLLANPDHHPRRTLRFVRPPAQPMLFRFWCQPVLRPWNDGNQHCIAILTYFTELSWSLQGQREISCMIYSFPQV